MSKLDQGPALDVPSLCSLFSLSLCSVQIKSPSVPPSFLLSFTTSYSVPSPDPYHEPKISRDIYKPAESKTASKEKADIFFYPEESVLVAASLGNRKLLTENFGICEASIWRLGLSPQWTAAK